MPQYAAVVSFQGSFCTLLHLYNAGAAAIPARGPEAYTKAGQVAAPPELDGLCAPYMHALLSQTAAYLIGASPRQQQQQEQQLKQLLLQDEEATSEAQQQSEDPEASEKSEEANDVEQQLQQERLQQQRERARKMRFAQLCRSITSASGSSSKSGSTAAAASSFYAPGNPVLLQPMSRAVQQFQEASVAFTAVVEDHPVLQGVLLISQRVASLSLLNTSPADALAALEGLLDRATAWQKAIDRHHLAHLIAVHLRLPATAEATTEPLQGAPQEGVAGDDSKCEAQSGGQRSKELSSARAAFQQQQRAAMQEAERLLQRFDLAVLAVERQVLLLRRRQLLEWRFLREFREQRMLQQSLHFAPFLWSLLPDDGDPAQPPREAQAAAAAKAAAAFAAGAVPGGDPGSQSLAGAVMLQLIHSAPTAVTDVLVQFLRTSPLGQFEGRLRCLEAASCCRRLLQHQQQQQQGATTGSGPISKMREADILQGEAASRESCGAEVVTVAMAAVARFAVASGWRRAVQQQLQEGRKEMDTAMSTLASLARWDISNRATMKESVVYSRWCHAFCCCCPDSNKVAHYGRVKKVVWCCQVHAQVPRAIV